MAKKNDILCALSIAALAALAIHPHSLSADSKQQAGKQMKERIDPLLVELSQARRLASSQAGEGAASNKSYQAYKTLKAKAKSLSREDIKWLQANGTAASRIYAAFLLAAHDPAQGKHSFVELLDDDSPVEYQSGCEVMKTSASEVGSSVVATGEFLDFDKTIEPNSKPIYFQELAKAQRFADQVGGEAGRHLEWLVFLAASKHARSLKPDDLEQLQVKGSPAGKLYAAVLMELNGKLSKDQAYAPLLGDKTKVFYISGCKMSDWPVSEVAEQLKSSGKFLNFKVRP